jgi:hypothetical protein
MGHSFIRDRKGGVLLSVYVQPKASETACVGMHGNALKIRVAALPVGGAANRELIRFLADELSLPTAAIHIESGTDGRHKRLYLEGITAVHVVAYLTKKGRPKW